MVNGSEVEDCRIQEGDSIEVRTMQMKVGELGLQPKPLIFYRQWDRN